WRLIELKLDRLIDEMRFLKSRTIAFDMRLRGIEAYLKPSEPSEQQPESKSTPWLAAAASATARTGLFGVGAAVGAAVTRLYLGTRPDRPRGQKKFIANLSPGGRPLWFRSGW